MALANVSSTYLNINKLGLHQNPPSPTQPPPLHSNLPEREDRIWSPKLKSGSVRNWNSDKSGFKIFNQIFQIWTRPDMKSGQVQILNIQLINKNLDTSEFFFHKEKLKIWTCRDFHLSIDKWKSGLTDSWKLITCHQVRI